MWSKLFSHLHLWTITWAVSSILVLCVAVLALQIAIDAKFSFINPCIPKCGHLLLQSSTFPVPPSAFPWTGQGSHLLRAIPLGNYLRLCISIWTKNAQVLITESLQEWGRRKRVPGTSATRQFVCITNWKQIVFFSFHLTDGDFHG